MEKDDILIEEKADAILKAMTQKNGAKPTLPLNVKSVSDAKEMSLHLLTSINSFETMLKDSLSMIKLDRFSLKPKAIDIFLNKKPFDFKNLDLDAVHKTLEDIQSARMKLSLLTI